jgi:hypothetical protein
VRRVGDEPAVPPDRLLEPVEGPVRRLGEQPDLVPGPGDGYAPVQVGGGDVGELAADRRDRGERAPDGEPGEPGDQQEQGGDAGQQYRLQGLEGGGGRV